jgi:Acyl-coenzyme A synthetases/AMP-(fatty) acid ligases
MDGYYRSGKLIDHKANADIAVVVAERNGQKIDKVLVWRRLRDQDATATPMVAGRDYDLREVMKGFAGRKVDPVSMPAEAPLFLMYTSGTTGRPKGCQHSTGGYLAYVAGTSNTSRISIRRTFTGAWRTSAGSLGIRISCTGLWR